MVVRNWIRDCAKKSPSTRFDFRGGMPGIVAGKLYIRRSRICIGLLTFLVGIAFWFVIPDSPASADFLSEDEKVAHIVRLRGDEQESDRTCSEGISLGRPLLMSTASYMHSGSLQPTFQIPLPPVSETFSSQVLGIPDLNLSFQSHSWKHTK